MTVATPEQHARAILGRVVWLTKVRETVMRLYERCDDPKQRVRQGPLAQAVADAMDVENSSMLRADIRHALTHAGWRIVKTGNRPAWKGVRVK